MRKSWWSNNNFYKRFICYTAICDTSDSSISICRILIALTLLICNYIFSIYLEMVSISFISIFFCFERKFFLKFFFKQGISSRFENEAVEYSLAIQNRKTAPKKREFLIKDPFLINGMFYRIWGMTSFDTAWPRVFCSRHLLRKDKWL